MFSTIHPEKVLPGLWMGDEWDVGVYGCGMVLVGLFGRLLNR
jgi:hypothetical protein